MKLGLCVNGSDHHAIRARHAFLWEDSSLIDLNTLVPPNSGLRLALVLAINDHGEIADMGSPPGVPLKDADFHGHAFVLIPCDENHPGIDGYDYSVIEVPAIVAQPIPAIRDLTSRTLPQSLLRRVSPHHFSGRAFGPKN